MTASVTPLADPRRWQTMRVCLLILFLTSLDFNVVVVALPSIGSGLHAGPSQLQWVVSGFALGFGLVPVVAGRLGDDRGQRFMLLVGTGAFIATSATIGLAPDIDVLIAARVLQGMGSGLLAPQVSGLIQTLFPPNERPRAFGRIGAVTGVGALLGPLIGGGMIALAGGDLGWRLVFLVNVPLAGLGFVASWRLLPRTPPRQPARRLDLPGITMLALASVGVLYPAVEFDAHRDALLWLLLIPAAAAGWAFYRWERGPARRRGSPLIDLDVWRIASFRNGLLVGYTFAGVVSGLPLIVSLFLQDGLGYGAITAGLVSSATAVGFIVSAMFTARLVLRFGGRLIVGALCAVTAGCLLVGGVVWAVSRSAPAATVGLVMLAPLLITGLGLGGVQSPNQALTLAAVDSRHGSTAGGTLQSATRFGMAIGAALVTAVYYSVQLRSPRVTDAMSKARQIRFGESFGAGALCLVLIALVSLAVAVRAQRAARASTDTTTGRPATRTRSSQLVD